MVETMFKSIGQAEVLVAGGGPAGLAAAIAARQAGFEVTVVDVNLGHKLIGTEDPRHRKR